MIRRFAPAAVLAAVSTGCVTDKPTIEPVDAVDLPRFMGDRHLIARDRLADGAYAATARVGAANSHRPHRSDGIRHLGAAHGAAVAAWIVAMSEPPGRHCQ